MRSPSSLAGLALSFALLVAACGEEATTEASTGSGGEELAELRGEIFVTGSSTVEPISIRVAEDFEEVAPDVTVDVEGPGTGDGFLKFCNGEADIADASRAIKEEEAQICAENGVEFIELLVAIDGIAVVTSNGNDAVDCLSFADLYGLLGPESEGFSRWSDAEGIATELGSTTDLPDAPLDITAPGSESGTYDSFIELVLAEAAEERGQQETTRVDYSSAADDNVIVTNVSANPSSLGWVGYAFYEQNQDALQALAVSEEPGGQCVEPSPETIASGEYPISRPLFIYVDAEAVANDPALRSFLEHYLQYGLDEAAVNAGYVALSEDAKQQIRSAWEA